MKVVDQSINALTRKDMQSKEQPSVLKRKSIDSLRVLFVIDSRFPGLGGAESQAIKLASALRQRGVHVEYVTPQVLVSQVLEEEYDGFRLRRIGYPHIKLFGSVVMMTKFAWFLIKHRHDFDIMHIHVTRLLTATAGVVRPITGVPIITKISGFFEFEGGVLDQRKRWHPVNALMRLAMKNVDYVQTISKETREKLLSSGFREDQLALIPNGIDTSEAPSLLPATQVFNIGYCGRLRDVKGVHVLIEGFALCKQHRPDAALQLLIAGSGETETKLRALAAEKGVTDSVIFLGLVLDTPAFYKQLHLYVQPSFAEGLPNSVMEAMHAGRTVVASDIGGNNDLLEENVSGHLFEAGDAQRLGEILVKCYDEQEDNVRMGANGRAVIEKQFGMDSVVDQLLEVYRG